MMYIAGDIKAAWLRIPPPSCKFLLRSVLPCAGPVQAIISNILYKIFYLGKKKSEMNLPLEGFDEFAIINRFYLGKSL